MGGAPKVVAAGTVTPLANSRIDSPGRAAQAAHCVFAPCSGSGAAERLAMNLVGKIFVVLIFVMSIVFATFSIMVYSTHTNWRDEIERKQGVGAKGPGWKVRYNEVTEANSRLKEDRDNLEKARAAETMVRVQAIAKAENEIARLNKENVEVAGQLKAKAEELTSNNNALHTAEENLKALTGEVQQLRGEIASSQKETDEQMVMDVSKARMKLKGAGLTLEGPADASQIPVFGKVTAVSPSKVELSIGTDDGVRIGQELDIYRGDKYVGRIRVVEAKPDNAVASIMTDYQQYPIQRGDNVDSQLRSTMKTSVKRAG
jgi:hypothetical protein